jgi:hypothetical protein
MATRKNRGILIIGVELLSVLLINYPKAAEKEYVISFMSTK